MIGLTRIKFQYRSAFLGLFLIGLGLTAPIPFNVATFRIYEFLNQSVANYDAGELIIAAYRLVILNTLRALPHYLGVLILAESVIVSEKDRIGQLFKGMLPLVIIPAVYRLISLIYGINYHFGIPALSILIFILYIEKVNYRRIKLTVKTIIISLLLLGVQCLDVIPGLSRYGFGRGESSSDIKMMAVFIGGEHVLTLVALSFCLVMVLCTYLIFKILADENRLKEVVEENRRVELELADARIKAVEARSSQEIHNLVHDLKSPLTSIQALVSVSELIAQNEEVRAYLSKIDGSVDALNRMISEILYEDQKNRITTEELMGYVFSQINRVEETYALDCLNRVPVQQVLVNKIRMSRALVNAIENAAWAVSDEGGSIGIAIEKEDDSFLCIRITDNGAGIPEPDLQRIWENGFSTKNSTGMGMGFIRTVVEKHGGHIALESIVGTGTVLSIYLPEADS